MVSGNVVFEVTFPDVPVMVTTLVPSATELLADSVRIASLYGVLVGLFGLGEIVAVTPVGRPETARVTAALNPLVDARAMGLEVVVPGPIDTLAGPVMVKFAADTVREKLAVDVSFPEVPVIVTELVPIEAVPVATNVKEVFPLVGLGEKLALTPLGRPAMDRVTSPLNPFVSVMGMLLVRVVPWPSTSGPGPETLKPGALTDN
jgi:hypothetical protein